MDSCSNPLVFRTRTALLRSAIFAKRRQGRELSSGSQLGNEECQYSGRPESTYFPLFLSLAIHPALYSCFLYTRIYNSRSFRYTTAVSILTSYKIGPLTIRRRNTSFLRIFYEHLCGLYILYIHIFNVCLELFVSSFIFALKHLIIIIFSYMYMY